MWGQGMTRRELRNTEEEEEDHLELGIGR